MLQLRSFDLLRPELTYSSFMHMCDQVNLITVHILYAVIEIVPLQYHIKMYFCFFPLLSSAGFCRRK